MMRRVIVIALLLVSAASCQEIQEEAVRSFSGGWVNSVSNSLIKPEQAVILENYRVTDVGSLERRPGLELHHSVDGIGIQALATYFEIHETDLLVTRLQSANFGDDTAKNHVMVLTRCVESEATCTTTVYEGFYSSLRSVGEPFGETFVKVDSHLIVSQQNAEMMLYNGVYAFPARPRAPGQAIAIPLDGGGNLDGSYWYKTAFKDSLGGLEPSNLSTPTWRIDVNEGKAFIFGIPVSADPSIEATLIYRKDCDTCQYKEVQAIDEDSTWCLDNLATPAAADTTYYEWGTAARGTEYYFPPPGGLTMSGFSDVTSPMADSFGIGARYGYSSDATVHTIVGYSIMYEDKFGVRSMPSAPVFDTLTTTSSPDTAVWRKKASLTNIPTPIDSGVQYKFLCRIVIVADFADCADFDPCIHSTRWYRWYIIDTLDLDATSYTDSLSIAGVHTDEAGCDDPVQPTVEQVGSGGGTVVIVSSGDYESRGEIPEDECYSTDSVLTFKPIDIAFHGRRMYAIGYPEARERLYFSDFGRPTIWPSNKFLRVPSQGDWPVRILSVSNDRLLIFQHNSIYVLQGLSFYQYQNEQLGADIGLSARRSLAYSKNLIYFLHENGVYQMSRMGELGSAPVSQAIKNSIDSVGTKLNRAFGTVIEGDYWLSVAIDSSRNEKTYIYRTDPVPHWEVYSFGLQDAVMYNYDTSQTEFTTDRWILALTNDSLYRYGYSSTDSDGVAPFTATYRSKVFFDDPAREKIFYVDIDGTGTCDSLELMIIDLNGDTLLTDTASVDFTDNKRDRIVVDKIVSGCQVQLRDFGYGDYVIRGYYIGYLPWDRGRRL